MSLNRKKPPDTPATHALKSRILAQLAHNERMTIAELVIALGISKKTAVDYTFVLLVAGEIHRVQIPSPSGGRHFAYSLGKKPLVRDTFGVRVSVKAWEPMRIVDPWMLPRAFFQPTGMTA